MRTPLLKKTIIFLAIFLTLVAGLFWSRPGWHFWEKKPSLAALPSLKKEDIHQLVIIEDGGEKKIEKKNNQWQVESFMIDEKVVNNCLDLILGLKKETLASDNKDKFSKYGLDDKSPKIKLGSGKKMLAVVLIGKSGPTYGTNYFQIAGEDRVWLSEENLATACQPTEWRDLTIFSFDSQKVKSYQIQEKGNNFFLVKNGEEWKLEGQADKKLKAEEINSTLSALANLKAKDVLLAEKEMTKFSAATTVTVTLDDDKKYTLQISSPLTSEKDSDFKAKTEDGKFLYLIPSYTREEISPKLADLIIKG